jgi:hypothetical protein
MCRAGLLFAVAGNLLRIRAGGSPLLSRRVIAFDRADPRIHAGDDCSKDPWPRHHLRLFRPCQPKLELPGSPGDESRNSRGAGSALAFESFGQVFVRQALWLRAPRQPKRWSYNPARGVHFVCEYWMDHDQKAEIRQISVVFPQEKSEDGQTKKSRDVQHKSCGEETRTRRSALQTALAFGALLRQRAPVLRGRSRCNEQQFPDGWDRFPRLGGGRSWPTAAFFACLIKLPSVFQTVVL